MSAQCIAFPVLAGWRLDIAPVNTKVWIRTPEGRIVIGCRSSNNSLQYVITDTFQSTDIQVGDVLVAQQWQPLELDFGKDVQVKKI